MSEAIHRGEAFLEKLRDPELGLLPEYEGAKVYWLFHDNYLAAKVLEAHKPAISKEITAAIQREGITKSGKIEILFGEAKDPLPFHRYRLNQVRQAGNKIIRTEVVTERPFEGWENYADLLLLASIAEKGRPDIARAHWEAALKMWDDPSKGFLDAVAKNQRQYATYKLGLALIAASRLSPPAKPPQGVLEKLLSLQSDSGGWITDYDAKGRSIGLANVETTCIGILGLEAAEKMGLKPTPGK